LTAETIALIAFPFFLLPSSFFLLQLHKSIDNRYAVVIEHQFDRESIAYQP